MRLQRFVTLICFGLGCVIWNLPASAASAEAEITTRAALLDEIRRTHHELVRLRTKAEHPKALALDPERVLEVKRHLDEMTIETLALEAQGDAEVEQKRRRVELMADALQADLEFGAPRKSRVEIQALGASGAPHGAALCARAETLRMGSWTVPRQRHKAGLGERWFRLTAPFAGRFGVDTKGSGADTRLSLYGACDGEPVATDDDTFGLASSLGFDAEPEQTLWLKVEAAGPGSVALRFAGLPTAVGRESETAIAAQKRGTESLSSLSGTVTAATAGVALEDIDINLYRDNGSYWSWTGSARTDASGAYRFDNLQADSYKVRTSIYSSNPYLNQVYPSASCTSCDLDELGEAVSLDGSDSRTDIDFALLEGSTLLGWVQDGTTGIGLHYAQIKLWSSEGSALKYVNTDEAGRYVLRGLVADNYRVTAYATSFYGEGWGGERCVDATCGAAAGNAVDVLSEATVTNINFSLTEKGRISGRVVDSTGAPIRSVRVAAYDGDGGFIRSASTGPDGNYLLTTLPAGSIFLRATGSTVIGETWPDIQCAEDCDPTLGTSVTVVDTQTTADIDFTLQRYSTVTGTVIDDGDPGYGGRVSLYDGKGNFVESGSVYSDGTFNIHVPPGLYYAVARETYSFLPQIWQNRACDENGCDPLTGDPILVGPETEVTDIDFHLVERGRISGRVTATGGLDSSIYVQLFDATGSQVDSAYADDTYSFSSLDPGTYYVGLVDRYGFKNELYESVDCPSPCNATTGTPIVLGAGEAVEGIDLELQRLGIVRGTVRDATTDVVPSGRKYVYLYDASGQQLASDYISSDGNFFFNNLQPGNYFLLAQVSGYLDQLWQSIDCFPSVSAGGCNVTSGTPVVVEYDGDTSIHFAMDPGLSIRGTTRDVNGATIGSFLEIYDRVGRSITTVRSYSSDGTWEVTGLVPGFYRVQSRPGTRYMSLAWPSTYCSGGFSCHAGSGTSIEVSAGGVAGIDFSHQLLGSISGQVTSVETGAPIPGLRVYLYSSGNVYRGFSYTGSDGIFEFSGLAGATYYVATADNSTYLDEAYGAGVCETDCSPSVGTPLSLGLFQQMTDVDLDLERSRGVRGRVTSAATGQPLPGVAVDFWYDTGSYADTAVTDADGRYEIIGITYRSEQSYFVSTHNSLGYYDQLWGGVRCEQGSAYEGACDYTQGALYEIREDQPVGEMNFALETGPMIFTSSFENGLADWSSSTQ